MLFSLETDWAAVCFELKTSGEQLDGPRVAFQTAHDLRKELFEGLRSGELDRQMMGEEMASAGEELTASLEKSLSAEQMAQLEELRSQRRGGFGGFGRGRRQE